MKQAAKTDPSQCSKVYIQLMRNLAKMLAQPGREKKELTALLLKIVTCHSDVRKADLFVTYICLKNMFFLQIFHQF